MFGRHFTEFLIRLVIGVEAAVRCESNHIAGAVILRVTCFGRVNDLARTVDQPLRLVRHLSGLLNHRHRAVWNVAHVFANDVDHLDGNLSALVVILLKRLFKVFQVRPRLRDSFFRSQPFGRKERFQTRLLQIARHLGFVRRAAFEQVLEVPPELRLGLIGEVRRSRIAALGPLDQFHQIFERFLTVGFAQFGGGFASLRKRGTTLAANQCRRKKDT